MRGRKLLSWTALVGCSFGFHAMVFARLDNTRWETSAARPKEPAFVEMTVSKPKPVETAAPEPAKPATPARAVRRVAMVKSPSQAAAPRPSAPTASPVAETPADFTGTTLTGGSEGWASATGNGEAMRGPIGRPGAKVTGRTVERATPAPTAGPAIVAVADLSRPPVPPSLDEALERNYPADARRAGQAGKAMVRARISASGQAQDLFVMSESAAGFGQACKQTLAGSRWTPPLDREGNPVATVIHYTCRFQVR